MSCCFTSSATRLPAPPRRFTRWPGITHAALYLGVSRFHLYSVLEGRRKSLPLLSGYRALAAADPSLGLRLP